MAQELNAAGRPSAFPMAASAGTITLIATLAALGFALTVLVFFPGYLTNDATFVYQYMRDWRFGDWQSPLMSMLWWVIDPISPGPGSMFLLIAIFLLARVSPSSVSRWRADPYCWASWCRSWRSCRRPS